MSRLTDLIRQAKEKDPALGRDLEAEVAALSSRRQFGLNFERHQPEAVELPGRLPRKGDKVRVLPPRGATVTGDQRLWKVAGIVSVDGTDLARLHITDDHGAIFESADQPVDDVVVVAEFRDPIYPGLVSTGRVERGSDKPHHTVINAENFHALQTLQFTHRGKVDAIYIDPPYNTGAKDWKYNNDYVDGEDIYRHSKWLAFIERRLKLAKELLNPENSVLIITIDEKEVHRVAILLEQTFPEARIQQVTSVISSQASVRDGSFARCDEFIFFVMLGASSAGQTDDDMLNEGLSATKSQLWFQFVRTGSGNLRVDRKGMFYPIFTDPQSGRIHSVGSPIAVEVAKETVTPPEGTVAVWPETSDGQEGRWRTGPEVAARRAAQGLLRLGRTTRKTSGWSVLTVNSGTEARINSGEIIVEAIEPNGAARLKEVSGGSLRNPKTVWNRTSHNAGWHGSKLLAAFIPGRKFPFPKSLYAVEDALRFFIQDKLDAVVLDFFAGSGSTTHAVMRLNRQDGGRRQSISVTNNEVSAEEQKRLRKKGLRPGDPEWEALGICDYITKPRIDAAITGFTPDGEPIKGEYRFTDEFPMAEGLAENVEFFTLTYESPWRVARGRAFDVVAPLLWMRAGSEGRRIDEIPAAGWDVADVYGVITDLDQTGPFLDAVTCAERVRVVFIVTDDDRTFQSVCAVLPERVEPVRLYESYLRNFEIKGRD
ncbi:site-specific DNA-methyltransferase (plasmid) [Citricoccus nitrophenolicus]